MVYALVLGTSPARVRSSSLLSSTENGPERGLFYCLLERRLERRSAPSLRGLTSVEFRSEPGSRKNFCDDKNFICDRVFVLQGLLVRRLESRTATAGGERRALSVREDFAQNFSRNLWVTESPCSSYSVGISVIT